MQLEEKKRARQARPWLKPDGRPIGDTRLKQISREWSAEAWEDYLSWFESSSREKVVGAKIYDALSSVRSETVYQEFGYETDQATALFCDLLLKSLPEREEKVLRLSFFEGLADVKIAAHLRKSRSRVQFIKSRAISRLRKEKTAAGVATIHFMKGLGSLSETECLSLWNRESPASQPIREDRSYSPILWAKEKEALANPEVKSAVAILSEPEWQVLFWRYWCDERSATIAHRLKTGINAIENLCDKAAFKLKSQVALNAQPHQEILSALQNEPV